MWLLPGTGQTYPAVCLSCTGSITVWVSCYRFIILDFTVRWQIRHWLSPFLWFNFTILRLDAAKLSFLCSNVQLLSPFFWFSLTILKLDAAKLSFLCSNVQLFVYILLEKDGWEIRYVLSQSCNQFPFWTVSIWKVIFFAFTSTFMNPWLKFHTKLSL